MSRPGCWPWLGHCSRNGYGRLRYAGVGRMAHRFVFEHLVGAIPTGLVIDHLCRNHRCVNPEHLEPVTQAENVRRGVGPALARERWAQQTHCKHGHEFTPANTHLNGAGSRECRACKALRARLARSAA